MASGNKKSDDNAIIGLNSVGISLGGIGERLGIHHTTVTSRLKTMGIPPADTRRAFMEDIYDSLPEAQKEWLVNKLSSGGNIKDYIKSLINKEFISRKI